MLSNGPFVVQHAKAHRLQDRPEPPEHGEQAVVIVARHKPPPEGSFEGFGKGLGGGQAGAPAHTKRGLEKQIFNATIIIAVLFVASTMLALFI